MLSVRLRDGVPRVEIVALDLRPVPQSSLPRAEFDAFGARERIGGTELRLVDEDAIENQVLRDGTVRLLRIGVPAVRVRDVRERRAVVPPVSEVLIHELSSDVLHLAVRLDAHANLPVAQLVAEEERHPAGHPGTERTSRRHPDRWLPDCIERE
jgi:hypothetical protein